jgi:hypothetical protein
MINAIISIVTEENNEDNDKKEESSQRRCRQRKALPSENNLRQIRREMPGKRKDQKYLNVRELKRKLNLEYFYDLLFTRKNLKLVHIVCHDKQLHLNKKCDESKLFV